MLAGGLLTGLIVAGGVVNMVPSLLYWHEYGPNEQVGHRDPTEAQLYGLKVAQLILPVRQHRVKQLAEITADYNKAPPVVNAQEDVTLGLVGTAGFIVLIGWVLLRRRGAVPQLPDGLSLFTLVAVLLGTIGGFGVVFNLLVMAQIRCYNRVSIYIAFFALALVAWALDSFVARYATSPGRRRVAYGLIGVLLILGICDQSSPAFRPDHVSLRRQFAHDGAFVAAIEARLPPARSSCSSRTPRFPKSRRITTSAPTSIPTPCAGVTGPSEGGTRTCGKRLWLSALPSIS